jgi:hypothetical protein
VDLYAFVDLKEAQIDHLAVRFGIDCAGTARIFRVYLCSCRLSGRVWGSSFRSRLLRRTGLSGAQRSQAIMQSDSVSVTAR